MPASSLEIANEFIRLAAEDDLAFDSIQLQKLVYIAHGICLAHHGMPLTADRAEAWEFGPVYRQLWDALGPYGLGLVCRPVQNSDSENGFSLRAAKQCVISTSDPIVGDIIADVYNDYGHFSGAALSALTRRGATPWREVFADGAGRFREIPDELIRVQFANFSNRPRRGMP